MLPSPTGDSYNTAHTPIDPYTLPKDGEWGDEDALRLTVQDAENAEAWIQSHYFHIRWIDADFHYQSPPSLKVWEGTSVPRSNVSRYTVATHINAILAQVLNGLFYEDPAFMLRPRPSTTENTIRAITAVMEVQLEQIKFRKQIERGMFSALLFGTGIWKYGWRTYTEVKKKFVRREQPIEIDSFGQKVKIPTKRSQSFDVTEEAESCSEPYIEALDNRYVLVDPGCRTGDIRDAKFVIHKLPMTYRDLMKLREEQELMGNYDYTLPSENEIRSWFEPPQAQQVLDGGDDLPVTYPGTSNFWHHAAPRFEKTTIDPLDEPLEILERWTDERVMTVINRVKVIRNCRNPLGCKPFLSVNWWNIPDAFWGLGLGLLLSGEQRIQQGITNASLDMVSLILNPMAVRSRGANVSAQAIRQRLGGIIDVDGDPEKAFRYQEVPTVPPEIFAQIQQSEARAESVSGANELLTQGNMPERGRTSIGRTATGASALAQAASSRLGKFVEDFNDQVFAPWLNQMHMMNCEFLPVETLQAILGEELGKDFEIDESDYFNASIAKFEILAGSHLAVKQQMAQAVVLMSQLFESPQIMSELANTNGQYVDVAELMHMISDMSGFKNYYSIVKPLTPQMEQRLQAMNPAAAQAQGKSALMKQKQEGDAQLADQKSINRAVELGLRQTIEQSFKDQAITGEPGGKGFGTSELG